MRRTKAEAQETRQAIIEAAEQVFFERGVARTTLEDVARAAGEAEGIKEFFVGVRDNI